MILYKPLLRKIWRRNRLNISAKRRTESIQSAKKIFDKLLLNHIFVLSYASFADEFDTSLINKYLCEKGKLILPKVEENKLNIFYIKDIDFQTKKTIWGIVEPIPHLCKKANSEHLSLALVPGLAFDLLGHRLGYGKGFYDRFLPTIAEKTKIIGLGFKEQLMKNQFIPVSAHDFPLHEIMLF
jgi:5-formyltetrahydrofolate cyclo-ligase